MMSHTPCCNINLSGKIRPQLLTLRLSRHYHKPLAHSQHEKLKPSPVPRAPALTKPTSTNPFMWNALVRSANGNPTATIALFKKILQSGVKPNGITFSFAIKAFAGLGELRGLMCIHSHLLQLGFQLDIFALNTLLNGYVACKCMNFARSLFDELPERDLVSWTVMMNGYVRSNHAMEATELFALMIEANVKPDGKALIAVFAACAQLGDLRLAKRLESSAMESGVQYDIHVTNSLIDMYAKCGSVEDARRLFESAVNKDTISWNSMVNGYARSRNMAEARKLFEWIPGKNEVSWCILISGYVQNGDFMEALSVFHEMRARKVVPNNAALTSAVTACAHLGALDLGREIHSSIDECKIESDAILSTALVDMYAKCGCLQISRILFDRITRKTLVSWNVMIMGMAIHGNALTCFELFSQLLKEGLTPNSDTFVGILTGCAHAGWLSEGKDCFIRMTSVYGITPQVEHFSCMIHLICQAGHFHEATEFIKALPATPDVILWGALLSACNTHGNVQLGEFAAERILELDPFHTGAYVQLSSIYARANMWKEVLKIRTAMKDQGIKNRPGWSSFEVDGTVHEFLVGDDSHPMNKDIIHMLAALEI